MTRAEQIRNSDETQLADIICAAMPGRDCGDCDFKERSTGRCKLIEWLQEEIKDEQTN